MKISMFHLMPHRELPPDFETRYESVWVTPPWWELADARRVGQYYNWTIEELHYAAQCGFDGVCTNEHHQNAYGFMPSPNIMGSVLAKLTNGSNVAIVQMGATLPTSNPPIRVAEEYAMLDCISGGRLVAGLPLGSPMDVNAELYLSQSRRRGGTADAWAVGTARRRDRRTRAPDVGNGRDEQVHLADPGQGVEEANPSRLRANAHRLGCGRPARAVSLCRRVLEASRRCAGPYHHGRRSCASPRASGIGSRSRPRLSDHHAALTRSNTVYGVSRDRSRQSRRGQGIATSAAAWEQAMNACTVSDRGTWLSFITKAISLCW